jgi:hypothetical protein
MKASKELNRRTHNAIDAAWMSAITGDDLDQMHRETFAERHAMPIGTNDSYAGAFYADAQEAYHFLYNRQPLSPNRRAALQTKLKQASKNIVCNLIGHIDNPDTFDEDRNRLIGVVNEFTPILIGNSGQSMTFIASRDDDRNHKTDLLHLPNVRTRTNPFPVQVKTDMIASASDIPEAGILLFAEDFNNTELQVSRVASRLENGEGEQGDYAILRDAKNSLSQAISVARSNPMHQVSQLRNIRRRKYETGPLSYRIGSASPLLNELKVSLSETI